MPPKNDNKRIAKNTLVLYIRMFVVMCISFYTSRVVLHQLGVVDYGVYNVVAGVVSMMTFLNSSMAAATQRFLAYDIGKNDETGLRKTFSMAINIHLIIAGCVFLLSNTIGLWFVINKLEMPQDSRLAAVVIFELAIIQTCLAISVIPRTALTVASEKMTHYAAISFFEASLKLVSALLLIWIAYNKLILYGILNLLFYIPIAVIWVNLSRKLFPKCRYIRFWDSGIFKRQFSFAGWQTIGSLILLMRTAGINVIINMFFGPVLNTARGIAVTINSTALQFVSNFQVASTPQITKTYASGNYESMHGLIRRSSKFSFMLMMIIAVPLICKTEFILKFWLGLIPPYSIIFAKLILIATLTDLMSGTLVYGALATGKIKKYQIVLGSIMLSEVIITILAYKLGYPAYSIYIIDIIINVVALFARLVFVRKMIELSIKRYLTEVIKAELLVLLISLCVSYSLCLMFPEDFLGSMSGIILSLLISIAIVWTIGIDSNEKKWIKANIINQILHRN